MAGDINIRINATDNASKVLKTVGKNVATLGGRIKTGARNFQAMAFSVQGIVQAAAGAGALRVLTKEMERIDELAKTGRKLGLPTDELVGFRLAAEKLAGMDSGAVDTAIQRMTRRIAEAATGSGEAVKALEALNLSAEELNLAGPAEAFKQIADAMQEVDNPADRLATAFKLFDTEGAALVNVLAEGREGIEAMKSEADALGLTFSDDVAKNIEQTNDALTELKKAGTGLISEITQGLAPALKVLAEGLGAVAAAAGETLKLVREQAPEVGATFGEMLSEGAGGRQARRQAAAEAGTAGGAALFITGRRQPRRGNIGVVTQGPATAEQLRSQRIRNMAGLDRADAAKLITGTEKQTQELQELNRSTRELISTIRPGDNLNVQVVSR